MGMPSSTAQVNLVTRTAIVRVGEESTPGVEASTFVDCRLIDSPQPQGDQTEIENMQQSDYLADDLPPQKGLKSCTMQAGFYIAPATGSFGVAATPADTFQTLLLKAAFGGQNRAAGSLVVAAPAPTTTSFSVTPGQGTRFTPGQIIGVVIGTGIEENVVTAVSTDAITVLLPFSGAPATGAIIYNSTTFYYSQTNSVSLSVRWAHASNANYQWLLLFCAATGIDFKIQRDAFLEAAVTLKGGAWTGPDALSISQTAATNDCIAPIPGRDMRVYLFPSASPVRTHMPTEDISVKFDPGVDHVKQIGGSTEGLVSVMRVGKRAIVTVTLKVRTDRWQHYLWENRTDMTLMVTAVRVNGVTTRGVTLIVTGAMSVTKPKEGAETDRGITTVTLRGQVNKFIPTPATDQAKSPVGLGIW